MTGEEHAAAIRAAIQAAEGDGYRLGFESSDFDSVRVSLTLWQNRRGEDGVMRRTFEEEITDGWT